MTLTSSEYQLLCVVGLIGLVLVIFVLTTIYYFLYGRFLGDDPMEKEPTLKAKDNEVSIFKKKQPKNSFKRTCLKKILTTVFGTKNTKLIFKLLDQGVPSEVRLLFELLVLTMLVFYVDLALDVQALITFTQTGDRFFFLTNLSAIVVAALYTAFHIFEHGERLLADLSNTEIFALGISYVFQLHIVYLCWISWKRRKKHQLLIDAKFAEAAIEAVVSALVQTYAVVFRCDDLEDAQELTLYVSILGSLASISSAFTLFDAPNGIDEAPGNEPRIISPKLAVVNMFRLCELTNKIGALALFQFATRPFGGATMVTVDAIAIAGLIRYYGGQVQFVPPCVFALMNPMLEKHNAVAMPHHVYYSLRAVELATMCGVASAWTYYRMDASSLDDLGRIFQEMYSPRLPVVLALIISTIGMFALIPVVRAGLAIEGIMEYSKEEWARKPFSTAQRKIRDSTLRHAGEKKSQVADAMNVTARKACEVCKSMNLVNVNAFMERTGESPVGAVQLDPPPLIVMTKMLHIMYNSPLTIGKPDLRKTLMKYTLDTLDANPALMAETFVRTRGMHALASLILEDCALSEDGLESHLDGNLCELFISASCKLIRQVNTNHLQELRASDLPRALCATVLEEEDSRQIGKREPLPVNDKRQACLSLANLYSGVKHLNFTSEGMQALLQGALEDEALEPMLVCPRLLLELIDQPEIRAHLPDAAAPCMQITYKIVKILDKQLKTEDGANRAEDARTVAPRLPSDHEKLLDGQSPEEATSGVGDYVLLGAKAALELIAVLVREMPRAAVAGSYRLLAKLVQEQQSTNLGPAQARHKLAHDLKVILGTKDKVEYLPLAFEDGADPTQKLPGTSTPLLHSAIEGGCDRSAMALFRAGAARLAGDEIGRSAFHVAIMAGSDHLLPALQIDKSHTTAKANGSVCCGGATYTSVATEDLDIEIGGAAPSQLRCLEAGKCPKGQSLQEIGTVGNNSSRKESVLAKAASPKVKLGRWRLANDVELLVRVRHGFLVATKPSGTEVWMLPHHLEVGVNTKIHSWTAGQEAWWKEQLPKGEANQEDARAAAEPDMAEALSLDHMVVCGVQMYFVQFMTAGYEKNVIFTGKTMQFDGRGDSTRAGNDWVNVYGQAVITNGVRMFEFTVHKVKCNTYVGVVAADGDNNLAREYQGASWSVRFKPQHGMILGLKFAKEQVVTRPEFDHLPPDLRVGMLLDMDRRAVRFFVEGEPKGPVRKDLPEAVKLHVNLDSEGDRVSFIELPVTRELYEDMEKEFTEAVVVKEAETWQCASCLTEHHTKAALPQDSSDQEATFVKGWCYDQGALTICEGCRTGTGPMYDGVTALSLAVAQADASEEQEDAGASAVWAMSIHDCYSKKQAAEAILCACLADNSAAAQTLLKSFSSYPQKYRRPSACHIGRFSKGIFDPIAWSLQEMAMIALHVSIYTVRKDTVEMLVEFFANQLEDKMFEAGCPKTAVELKAEQAKSSRHGYSWMSQQEPPKSEAYSDDPWFKNKMYSVLNAALCSVYATRREFLPHEHDIFPRFGAEARPCAVCGFARAESHSAATSYAECALCTPIISKSNREKEDDLTKMVGTLLEKWVKTAQVTQGNSLALPWAKHAIKEAITWPNLDGDLVLLPPKREKKNGLSRLLETTVRVLEKHGDREVHRDLDEAKKEQEIVDDDLLKAQEKKKEGDEEEEEEEEDDDEGHEEIDYEAKEVDFLVVDANQIPPGNSWIRYKEVQSIAGAHGLQVTEALEMCTAVDAKGSRMELKLVSKTLAFPIRVRFTWQVLTGNPENPLKFEAGCNPFHFAAALESVEPLDMMIRVAVKDAEKFEVEINAPSDPHVKWWTLVGKELEERAKREEVDVAKLRETLTVRNKNGALLRYDPTGANQRPEDEHDEEDDSFISGSDQEDEDGIYAKSANRTEGFKGTNETARTEYPLKLTFGELPFNSKGGTGYTPLHVAACHNRPKNIQLLLDNGAKPAAATLQGVTPLMFALKFRFDEVASRLIAAITLEDPKLLNYADQADCTAMHYAADAGQMAAAALRQLLQSRADPVAKARNGTTPLLMAVSRSRLEAVKLLLQENAEWYAEVRSAIDFYGDEVQHTPLLAAVKADDRDIATVLVRCKADVNKHAKGSKRRPIDAVRSEAICRILCSTRQLELTRNGDEQGMEAPGSTGIGATIFAHLLRKRRGVKMAEVVMSNMGLQSCINAMRDGTTDPDPLEVEFFLDQVSTAMLRASDEARARRFAEVTQAMSRLTDEARMRILSRTLVLCTRRPDTFSREVQVSYICTLGVNRKEAMVSAIKRNKVNLLKAMLPEGGRDRPEVKDLQADQNVVSAMKKAGRQDTIMVLLRWLVGEQEYKKMDKRLKSGAPTTQLNNYKRALQEELNARDKAKEEAAKVKAAAAPSQPAPAAAAAPSSVASDSEGEEIDDEDMESENERLAALRAEGLEIPSDSESD